MSENRFWFVIDKGKLEYVQDNVTGEKITVSELEDLLNELYEENEQLRQFINKGRRLSVKELMNNMNENELLKKKIKKLEKDNEELKDMDKELIEFIKNEDLNLYDLAMNYIEMFNMDRLLENCDIELSEEDDKKQTISMLDAQDLLVGYVLVEFGGLGK